MRVLRFDRFGDPTDVLHLDDDPLPDIRPGQALVRMAMRPINPSDLLTISGDYGRLPSLPAVPGLEGMGTIAALGEAVSGWRVGDRVIPLGTGGGTWREFLVADPARLLPVPAEVPDESAAQFVVNPVTAWVMLEQELKLQPGEWLLQTAAGSTLGRLVIQLAKLRGYKTLNLVRRAEQVDEILALGGDVALWTGDDGLVGRVRELTGGAGVRAAIEAVGGETGALALHCLRPGGTMIVYGLLSNEPTSIHNSEMLFRGLTVRGFWLAHWLQKTPPAQSAATLAELMRLMGDGRLVPPVAGLFDLADFREAITLANQPGRQGKVLLTG